MANEKIIKKRKSLFRKIIRWFLWIIAVLLILFALQATVLAFPQLIVGDNVQVGFVKMYYDDNSAIDIKQLAEDVDRRLRASGFYDSTRTECVFYFQSQRLYTLFARLSLVTPLAQGYNLSVFHNSFISGSRIAALAERTGGIPKYGIWEGSAAHIIAHEIGHQYVADRIGRGIWRQLPHWKQEGLPEYIANIGTIRLDTAATLPHRIDILEDDFVWSGYNSWDRVHYRAELLVEYLIEKEGYTIEGIIADSVTLNETNAAMMEWYAAQNLVD